MTIEISGDTVAIKNSSGTVLQTISSAEDWNRTLASNILEDSDDALYAWDALSQRFVSYTPPTE